MFANFGRPSNFTLGELVNGTYEVAFPSMEINTPPSLVNTTNKMYGANYADYLISLQSVYGDPTSFINADSSCTHRWRRFHLS